MTRENLHTVTARARRVPAWIVVGLCAVSSLAYGAKGPAASSAQGLPTVIEGSGDSDVVGDLVSWQNTLIEAQQPTDFQYFQRGTTDGRAQLLQGLTQFAISGVPYSAAELAARPADSSAILEVPIAVSSLTIVATTPDGVGWNTEAIKPGCDPNDPDIADPEACYERGVFTNPIRLPAESLGALGIGLSPSFEVNRKALWESDAVASALGTKALAIQSRSKRHTFVNRSEGSAANRYLMIYAKVLAPEAWELRKKENPEYAWEPIGEQMSPRTVSRYGSDTQMGIIAISNVDAATNQTPDTWSGNMGAVPTNQVARLQRDYPLAGLREVQVQNHLGEYVSATTAAVAASLAGGTDPLTAATTDVPGGYPFVWITHMYVLAGSLTPAQANAMAATVRYIVTDGQVDIESNGGVRLPTSLRDEALAAADAIVIENCLAAGYEVTTSGPAASETNTPQVQTLTSLKHCTEIVAPVATTTTSTIGSLTTTTLAPNTTAAYTPPRYPSYVPPAFTPVDPPSIGDGAGLIDDGATTSVDTATTVLLASSPPDGLANPGAGAGGVRPQGQPLSNLPLTLPADGRNGFKKLGTLLMGATLFLVVRRVLAGRRFQSSAAQ